MNYYTHIHTCTEHVYISLAALLNKFIRANRSSSHRGFGQKVRIIVSPAPHISIYGRNRNTLVFFE